MPRVQPLSWRTFMLALTLFLLVNVALQVHFATIRSDSVHLDARGGYVGEFRPKPRHVSPQRVKPAEKSRDQVLVLGMHHSGTSVLTMILSLVGISTGARKNLLIRRDNPMKYWELRDAVRIDQHMFNLLRPKRGHSWLGYGFSLDKLQKEFPQEELRLKGMATNAIHELQRFQGRPWAMKDPRMSLTTRFWIRELDAPLCLLVVRNPVDSAYRFLGYNKLGHNFNITEWIGIWEEYTVRSLEACFDAGAPVIRVLHHELGLNPMGTVSRMLDHLVEAGLPRDRVKMVSKETLISLLGLDFEARHRTKAKYVNGFLPSVRSVASERAFKVWSVLKNEGNYALQKEMFQLDLKLPAWTPLEKIGDEAYYTIVDLQLLDLLQSRILALSIRQFDSKRDIVMVIVTKLQSVPERHLKTLKSQGWIVQLEKTPVWREQLGCSMELIAAPTFAFGLKPLLWKYESYELIVYLDFGSLVVKPLDEWFGLLRDREDSVFDMHITKDGELHVAALRPEDSRFREIEDTIEDVVAAGGTGCLEKNVIFRYISRGHAINKMQKQVASQRLVPEQLQSDLKVVVFSDHSCPMPWELGQELKGANADDFLELDRCNYTPYAKWRLLSIIAGRTSEIKNKTPT